MFLLRALIAAAITTILYHIPVRDLRQLLKFTTGIIDGAAVISNLDSTYESHDKFPPKKTPEHFDFVIVGASPSGSVLANRLSEINGWKILLLEAGGDPTGLAEVPLVVATLYPTTYNWGTHAEPQPGFCSGCLDKGARYGHGKGLGGGSIINFMIFVRGNEGDYNKWEEMGNPGWGYRDLLPYFRKLEDASNVTLKDSEYRGRGGPLGVSDVPFRTKLTDVYINAAQQAGFSYVDYNGKQQIGVSHMQTTLRNGMRSNAENSYLRPIRQRTNLKIRTGAYVTKILIRPDTKEAYGVEYKKSGKMYTVVAKKEVILSAGGLNSPKILMLSGVGPKSHLEEIGIPVIEPLPVGEIMYDHVVFPGAAFLINEHIGLEYLQYIQDPKTYWDFLVHHKGPITSNVVESVAYFNTNLTGIETTRPDIELLFLPSSLAVDFGIFFKQLLNIGDQAFETHFKPLFGKPAFTSLILLLHPISKGYIKLNSSNPFEEAKYTLNYFTDPDNLDIKRIILAIRVMQKIASQPALQEFGAKIAEIPFLGCENTAFDSDEYWECAIRSIPSSMWHQQSACKMGPETDKEAVVDSRLRVHGIKNLRVVDTSIFPTTVAAHTVGPAYMVGEKAADIIKGYWKTPSNSK
ncbi:unnamed protein product [Acanthoscelides obtectus]|uniref:Glucose-methanol-choline oxidoreductase N-terminal domain-containing protein n=1 Tax=Acanthoscelides obtectus TaxID=200917 RepID=A0A9P0L058_ACAOB|nr:unnamed protein product [Acanthoscelides obtectus]CAK1679693.1 Glucose dehydrogenase [FAD, quinone] [Acanthoscelides obtectus]